MLSMRKFSFWWCIGALLTLLGCGSDEPQIDLTQIYQDYQVLYDAGRDSTFVLAGYWIGGSQVFLSANAETVANGVALDFIPQLDHSYEAGFAGRVRTLTITYQDDAGATYPQVIDLTQLDSIDISLDSMALSTAHRLSWRGGHVGPGEEVLLEVYAATPPRDYYNYSGIRIAQPLAGDSLLTIAPTTFDALGPGRRAYTLTRTQLRPLSVTAAAGGQLRLSYGTGIRPVVLH